MYHQVNVVPFLYHIGFLFAPDNGSAPECSTLSKTVSINTYADWAKISDTNVLYFVNFNDTISSSIKPVYIHSKIGIITFKCSSRYKTIFKNTIDQINLQYSEYDSRVAPDVEFDLDPKSISIGYKYSYLPPKFSDISERRPVIKNDTAICGDLKKFFEAHPQISGIYIGDIGLVDLGYFLKYKAGYKRFDHLRMYKVVLDLSDLNENCAGLEFYECGIQEVHLNRFDTTLRILNLARNKLHELNFVEYLPNLEHLDIAGNDSLDLEDFYPLRRLMHLKSLSLSASYRDKVDLLGFREELIINFYD